MGLGFDGHESGFRMVKFRSLNGHDPVFDVRVITQMGGHDYSFYSLDDTVSIIVCMYMQAC